MKIDARILFSILNLAALAGWILLILLPRWKWTSRLVLSAAVPLAFSAVYLALIASTLGRADGDFSSLDGVARLFRNEWVLLGGWVHYLAFDMLVGIWQVKDSQRLSIPHLMVVPCLALTFMLGPIGFLAYCLVSSRYRRRAAQ